MFFFPVFNDIRFLGKLKAAVIHFKNERYFELFLLPSEHSLQFYIIIQNTKLNLLKLLFHAIYCKCKEKCITEKNCMCDVSYHGTSDIKSTLHVVSSIDFMESHETTQLSLF